MTTGPVTGDAGASGEPASLDQALQSPASLDEALQSPASLDEALQSPASLDEALQSMEGRQVGAVVTARDAVNPAMIRHWCDAMGDRNPVYTDPDAAGASVHGGLVAPPTMLQAWTMPGFRLGAPSPSQDVLRLLDAAGFTSVVATNCEQRYVRYLRPGDVVSMRTVLESVSPEKSTALGVGRFVTQSQTFTDQTGQVVATMLWRMLKFRPGTGRGAPTTAAPAGEPRALRPRPAVTADTAWWFDACRRHRLLIQRCASCGRLRHPPKPMCPACRSVDWDTVSASGRATLYSFVVNHHPRVPAFDYPLPVGLVELEEGTRLVADLVGLGGSGPSIGQALTLEWADHDEDLSLPQFRPVEA